VEAPVDNAEAPVDQLTQLRERLAHERAIHEVMLESMELYQEMHGDDLSQYPEDVRAFAERRARVQAEQVRKRRHRGSSEEASNPGEDQLDRPPTQQSSATIVVPAEAPAPLPIYRTAGRFKEPKVYKGKSVRELNDFLASVRATFRYQPQMFLTEYSKVAFAAQYLDEEPMKEWDSMCADKEQEIAETMTFAQFDEFLRSLHADPVNRQRIAALSYNQARQRHGQSVRSFVTYLEELEHEMEPYTEAQKANHLLTKMHSDMRQKLVEGGYTQRAIPNRESLVNTIAMLETTTRWVKDHKPSPEKERKQGGRGNENKGAGHQARGGGYASRGTHRDWSHSSGYRGGSNNPRQPQNQSQHESAGGKPASSSLPAGDSSKSICYNC
jgi:hypothetical protein